MHGIIVLPGKIDSIGTQQERLCNHGPVLHGNKRRLVDWVSKGDEARHGEVRKERWHCHKNAKQLVRLASNNFIVL